MFSLAVGKRDSYDLRAPADSDFPYEYYSTYLQRSAVQKAIGAKVKYQECPDAPYNKFATTGDVRTARRMML